MVARRRTGRQEKSMSTIFQALDSKAGLIPEAAPPRPSPAAPLPLRHDPKSRIRVVPIQLAESSPLLPYDGSSPRAGEQYRTVRTNLLQNPDAPRVLVVSSCGSGDGKTLSAVNTAGALAIKGETTVLLVDADLRNPSLAPALGLPPDPGLADVLHGDCKLEDAIVETAQFPNLYVLPAGKARRNPAELLDSARLASTLRGGQEQLPVRPHRHAAHRRRDRLRLGAGGSGRGRLRGAAGPLGPQSMPGGPAEGEAPRVS
jgi:Mrp family chromosome partitioning ATPase